MSKKVTMAQIAALAGVSQPTVSLVLNGGADALRIKATTQEKVLQAAAQLGYQRANGIISQHTRRRLALVLDGIFITNDHFINALNEGSNRATELGLSLNIMHTGGSAEGRELTLQELNSGLYAGAIIATNLTCRLDTAFPCPISHVYLNCIPRDNPNVCAIVPDDYGTTYDLATTLATFYQRPLVVAGDEWMSATLDRCRALRDIYLQYGFNISTQDIIFTGWSFKEAYCRTLQFLHDTPHHQLPDIIYCGSDYLAAAVYQAIYRYGLTIPDDIAVVGFDDQSIAMELDPPLTTAELPYAQMGALAVELLDQSLNSGTLENKIHKIRGKVLRRKSA